MTNDEWVRERAGQLLNSPDRGIQGTASALESLELDIAAFGQEAIERGKAEQDKAVAAERERLLARLREPDEAMRAAVVAHTGGLASSYSAGSVCRALAASLREDSCQGHRDVGMRPR